jgi:hypothetical protein
MARGGGAIVARTRHECAMKNQENVAQSGDHPMTRRHAYSGAQRR